jgi:hypothetical protein
VAERTRYRLYFARGYGSLCAQIEELRGSPPVFLLPARIELDSNNEVNDFPDYHPSRSGNLLKTKWNFLKFSQCLAGGHRRGSLLGK